MVEWLNRSDLATEKADRLQRMHPATRPKITIGVSLFSSLCIFTIQRCKRLVSQYKARQHAGRADVCLVAQ